jgi:hypothetical protein
VRAIQDPGTPTEVFMCMRCGDADHPACPDDPSGVRLNAAKSCEERMFRSRRRQELYLQRAYLERARARAAAH